MYPGRYTYYLYSEIAMGRTYGNNPCTYRCDYCICAVENLRRSYPKQAKMTLRNIAMDVFGASELFRAADSSKEMGSSEKLRLKRVS